ncbi:MAG: hypothetical protein AAF433_00525 [Bacteroidota bacterium]
MDKTAFQIQTFVDAEDHTTYWRTRTVTERLRAATMLTMQAYNLSWEEFAKMDRNVFSIRHRMENNVFNNDFQEFVKCLNEEEVKYLLVGGYSVILHGYSRSTGDMDIWVEASEKNYQLLTKAFTRFGMPVFDMVLSKFLDTKHYDVFSFGREPMRIEILTAVKGLDFSTAFDRSSWFEFNDFQVRSLSLTDLKKAKEAAGRLRDKVDLEQLELIKEEE